MAKRKVTPTFADVWAVLLFEKIDKLTKKKNSLDLKDEKQNDEYRRLTAMESGMREAITLFTCLEDGRFSEDYDRALATVMEQRNGPKPKKYAIKIIVDGTTRGYVFRVLKKQGRLVYTTKIKSALKALNENQLWDMIKEFSPYAEPGTVFDYEES